MKALRFGKWFTQAVRLAMLALLVLWTVMVSAGTGTIAVITVCSDNCDYDNLSDAVYAAKPGDIIEIRSMSAEVKGPVLIDKDLTIRGGVANAGISPLVKGSRPPFATAILLNITAGTVRIENLTLQDKLYTNLPWPMFCPTVLRVEGNSWVSLENVKAWTRAGTLGDRGSIEVLDSASLTMMSSSIESDSGLAAIKIEGSPTVNVIGSSVVGIHITGDSPQVTIKGSTIRYEENSPMNVAVHMENLGSGGTVTISGNKGKVQQTVGGALRIAGAVGGSIKIINSRASVTIGGANPTDGNDIIGYGSEGGIAIVSSQNVRIQNNFIGYFGQKTGNFDNRPGILIRGDGSVVTISSNEITSNGGCGVLVENKGATVKGSGNRIYLNCVSSKCQKDPNGCFKKCGANLCPCKGDYDWPEGFGGGA